jgi:hypothetical protein
MGMTEPEQAYTCDTCPAKYGSLKELTKHYEKQHPELIEKLLMPI